MSQEIKNDESAYTINNYKVKLDKCLKVLSDNFILMAVDERIEFQKVLPATCKHVLAILPLPSLEKELFSKLLPKIEITATIIICKITPTRHKEIVYEEMTEHFMRDLIGLVKCIEICYDLVNSLTNIDLDNVYTLPKSSLSIALKLFNFYEICQEFDEFKICDELLSALFNHATSLTKNFISLWERVKIIISLKDHTDAVVAVCSSLNKICKVFEKISGKFPVTLWKVNISTLIKHCVTIKDQVDVAETIHLLCSQIEKRLKDLKILCSNDTSIAEKRSDALQIIQQCGFNLKIIINLVEKFQFYLGDCFKDLLYLILYLYGASFASLTPIGVPDVLRSDFERHVTLVIEPLILLLLNEPEFIYLLTLKRFEVNEPNQTPHSWIMFYIFIFENIHKLPGSEQDKLFIKNSTRSSCGNILQEFFDVFLKCFTEIGLPVLLPGVMCQGKPQIYVSFYQYCCTRFSSFIAGVSAQHFKYLEAALIDSVLSEAIWKSLLACDLLVFLGRLESAELCFKHCCLLADLTILTETNNFKIGFGLRLALKRLFNILATEHKVLYYRKYHPIKHPEIWACIGFKSFSSEYATVLHDDLDRLAVTLRDKLKNVLEIDFDKLNCRILFADLVKAVALLRELSQLPNFSNKSVYMNLCVRLWQHLPIDFVDKNEIAESLVLHLIKWICLLTAEIPNNLFFEVLIVMARLQQNCKSTVIRYGILQFLQAISTKNIPSSKEKDAILKRVAFLLSNCVQEENVILFHIALETFVNISSSTPHEIIITESLFQKPQLQNNITKFLNRVPFFRSEDLEFNLKETLLSQMNSCQNISLSKKDDIVITDFDTISNEPENVLENLECSPETKNMNEELSDDLKQTFIEMETGISKLSQLILHCNSNPKLIESCVRELQLKLKAILENNLN